MKKIAFLSFIAVLALNTSCDPNAKNVQEEDKVSEEILEEEGGTPAQYQGSTGVLREDEDNHMDAPENIELKKQKFEGSFASLKTQVYEMTVLEPDEYTFRLESGNPEVQYVVTSEAGDMVVPVTRETKTVMLQPGKYSVTGTVETGDGKKVDPETAFTIYIE